MLSTAAPDRVLTRLVRALRRTLDTVESSLRTTTGHEDEDTDVTTTTEILMPRDTGEPPARRAQRQAQTYMRRRQRRLRDDLTDR